MSRHLSTHNISSKSVHTFLSNLANRQTDRQTRANAFPSSFVGGNDIQMQIDNCRWQVDVQFYAINRCTSSCWNYDLSWHTLLHGRSLGAQHFMHLLSHSLCHVSFCIWCCLSNFSLVNTIFVSLWCCLPMGEFVYLLEKTFSWLAFRLSNAICASSCLHSIVSTTEPTAGKCYFYHFVPTPFEILGERLQVCYYVIFVNESHYIIITL